ncbi:uncharacterized protein LOC123702477 isoform X1 [Colias croceus]|uniref:uncharacterized protein LOC123702477 isoform X1 n=1 Tax=Colias crocea TaxID=72248 RepID=UPI001E27D598|nr:uncharacterized protein LOC123702477 isoform X1 [Colias croceus]
MKTSSVQFDLMVTFMERHGDLSKPSTNTRSRISTLSLWEDLTVILNSEGSGDTKSCEKWKKAWSDFKNNTKKKAARVHRASIGTGPAVYAKLTDLELRVLKMLGVRVAKGLQVEKAGLSQVTDKQPNVSVGNDTSQVTPQPRQSVELSQDDEPASPRSESPEPTQGSRASSPLIIIIKEEHLQSQPEPTEPETKAETGLPFPHEETQFEETGSHSTHSHVHGVRPHREETRSQIPRRARLTYPRGLRRHRLTHMNRTTHRLLQTEEFWRKFKILEHKDDMNLQRERNRIREMEVQVQAQWQALGARALDILDKLVDKYCKG